VRREGIAGCSGIPSDANRRSFVNAIAQSIIDSKVSILLPSLARFNAGDAPELLDLSVSIGWQHTIEDWRTSLAVGMVFGHRDESGRIVSSAAIYPYGPQLASIGLVIVRAEARRRGLARAAVLECLRATENRPVMLVATPEGGPLYESLGFVTVEHVVKLIAPAAPSLPAAGDCRGMTDHDLPSAIHCDARAFGADRTLLLERRWKQAVGGAFLTQGGGFAWSVRQHDLLIAGPVVAPDAERAAQLVGHLVAGYSGRIRIDVPARQTDFILRLAAAGFETRELRPVMLRSAECLAGRREQVFALVSLGFG